MADNYLEKRMEDHRRGVTNATPRRLTPSGRRAGQITLKLAAKRAFVALSDPRATEAVVKALAAVGCKVAFPSENQHEGNNMAQRLGALCSPVALLDPHAVAAAVDTAASRWDGLDLIIADNALIECRALSRTTIADSIMVVYTHIGTSSLQTADVARATITASRETDPTLIASAALFLASAEGAAVKQVSL